MELCICVSDQRSEHCNYSPKCINSTKADSTYKNYTETGNLMFFLRVCYMGSIMLGEATHPTLQD